MALFTQKYKNVVNIASVKWFKLLSELNKSDRKMPLAVINCYYISPKLQTCENGAESIVLQVSHFLKQIHFLFQNGIDKYPMICPEVLLIRW